MERTEKEERPTATENTVAAEDAAVDEAAESTTENAASGGTTAKKLSEMRFGECEGAGKRFAWLMNYIFIDGMSGMALGLFATLIAGTIIWELGSVIDKAGNNAFGLALEAVGRVAQITMGAGIGAGVCVKMKKLQPLVIVSACGAGMIGSYSSAIIKAIGGCLENGGSVTMTLSSAGDPMGAFIGGMVAMTIAALVSGKTKIDILVTPLAGIVAGAIAGVGVGYPVSLALNALGQFISWAASLSTLSAAITGFIVAAVMGVALTLPISSAAIGISIGLSGIAAGAAVVGCCCHMVGYAAMSFRENGWGGAVAQGLGTSMLQIPNLFRKPLLFLPPTISAAILGTISVLLPNGVGSGLIATPVGSGMGTAGLVGPIDMLFCMLGTNGCDVGLTLLWVALFCFVLPAALTLGIGEIFRRTGLMKFGDLNLNI